MEDIKRVQLSEIVELITKGTTPTTLGYEFQDEGVKFLKIECFDENGSFIESKVAHISEECHQKMKRSQLKNGDILFSIAGAIGRVAIVTEKMLPANTNQALAIIRISDEQVYLPYIKLILTSPIVIEQFERKKQGVAQLNLSLKDINEFSIPLPSKDKQIELAELFDKVVGVISKRNKELSALDDLVKARFVEMFGARNYLQAPISELVTGKVSNVKNVFSPDDEIKYIDISSIDNKRNVMMGYKEYVLREAPSRAQQHIKKGDIVISTVRPNLRNVAMTVFDDDNLVASSGFCVLRAEKCLPEYLLAIVCSDKFTDDMTKVVTGANYPAIKDSDVMNYLVSMPPMELQEQFADFVHQVDKSKFAVQKSLKETKLLFDSLMQQYFG